jgi:hypothetical protein
MFPILPSSGMQVEAHRQDHAFQNEEAHAQQFGRVVRASGSKGRASRARLILLTLGAIITLAVVAFVV